MAYRYITLGRQVERLVLKTLKPHVSTIEIINGIGSISRRISDLSSSPNILRQFTLLRSDVPKGFEKYFGEKKGSGGSSGPAKPKDSGVNKTTPKKDEGIKLSFQTGGGGGGGKSFDPSDPNNRLLIGLFTGVGIAAFLGFYNMRFREITWKEFLTNYLSKNVVEKLEVVNKKWVRVKLVPRMVVESSSTIWFNIGSVEAFERNLENSQHELNIEPANFVNVVYKTEAELKMLQVLKIDAYSKT